MIFIRVIVILFVLPWTEQGIYVFDTHDSSSVEYYDCVSPYDVVYCRRPSELISQHRPSITWKCYNDGIPHSFASLQLNNISVSTVLHKWQSSIEMAEEYSYYLKQSTKSNSDSEKYLCQCTNTQSFGKNCEYLLPMYDLFQSTIAWEEQMRIDNYPMTRKYGDILCYTTLICNSGLLCLDWREICDGIQQCMFGYDEENCDKLEFNECENNEYRCMNGMCIPDEYFLDGDYDCMDLSDENRLYDDSTCPYRGVNIKCDDRICNPNTWSCGDGQCISDRLSFQIEELAHDECENRRDQYYMCETHLFKPQWTLPNGRCYPSTIDEDLTIPNPNDIDECEFFIKCVLSEGLHKNCPCEYNPSCTDELQNPCNESIVKYPNGAIINSYIFFLFNATSDRDWYDNTPDFILINGTIKCRGYMITRYLILSYPLPFSLNDIEWYLCNSTLNSSIDRYMGYDEFCYNDSQTFNNRSYHFVDVCKYSRECISAYRIKDGFQNCADNFDEEQDEIVSQTCSSMKQYRFRCSIEEPTCLNVNRIGNRVFDCKNKQDESIANVEISLSNIDCQISSIDDCTFIRQYINISWNVNNSDIKEFKSTILFRAYCDTFWDLASKADENISMCREWWICHEKQWQCGTGQCIKDRKVLNQQWNCKDASDEHGIFISKYINSSHNLKIKSLSKIEKEFKTYYKNIPFSKICDIRTEFPCFQVGKSNRSINITHDQICLDLQKIGDGHIDCIGGIDEQNTLESCDYPHILGTQFKCLSSNMCFSYSQICDIRCSNKSDDDILCPNKEITLNCIVSTKDFVCLDGKCIKNGRCDFKHDCFHGEDEYLCYYEVSHSFHLNQFYQYDMNRIPGYNAYPFELRQIPINAKTTKNIIEPSLTGLSTLSKIHFANSLNLSSIPYMCNRGIDILMYNNSFACFCSPQYYGNKCQFHADRITVILQLDLSQSIYENTNDMTIVIKLFVLLLFENETSTSYTIHILPALDKRISSKNINYLLYSRSNKSLHHKRMRYFNRSNIINKHPYSIRIEAYESKSNKKPKFIGVWEYPIYFDYLPNFRLVKILRLINLMNQINPCSSNPCDPYQECHQLLNENSKYICICPSNYGGKNCSILDEMCASNYCSPNALCKPNYRNLLRRNENPYCICPGNMFGTRCYLEYDQCRSSPCKNNGTCFPTVNHRGLICICSSFYYGPGCEQKSIVERLSINQTIEHKGAVLQYFRIHTQALVLSLIYQKSFHALPYSLVSHLPPVANPPDIVLVKFYSGIQTVIYLIAVNIKARTINLTIQLDEKTHCKHVRTLFHEKEEISPIKYHHLCIKNNSLLCFIDDIYLCICAKNNYRVECLDYDYQLDHCTKCLADGRCLKGDRTQENDFVCICPRCYYGHMCQFNTKELSYTLDSLIVQDTFIIKFFYFILVIIMFFFGGLTNYASFVVFKRPKPHKIGVGNYLLIASIFNQCSLLAFLLKMIHIIFGSSTGDISCKIITYMLSVTIRYSYWLTSWVTIERVYIVIFPFSTLPRKPRLAILINFITLIIIAGMHIHELLFYISLKDSNNQTICVTTITQTMAIYNHVTILIHYIVPFCIQIISITLLIIFAARSRSRITTDRNILKQQFQNQKELYLTPVIIILSGLPQIILSFSFACKELLTWQRHVLLITYFLSYAPQLLGFVLFVLPSTAYLNEFRETQLAKTFIFRRALRRKKPKASIQQSGTKIK